MKTKVEQLCAAFFACCLLSCLLTVTAGAQLLKQNDYGVGVTVAIYQFDDTRSKQFTQVNTLKVTAGTPEEEIEYIERNFGAEDLKVRHVRTLGLREGEAFTDTQPMNEKQFVFVITPRLITKTDVTFDFTAKYGDQSLLELKSVTAGNYETVMLRGGRGGFGVREFKGPEGKETVPETRALLVTITPTVQTARSLQNKPSDISRPTDQFGSRVDLGESDTFIIPAVISRAPLKFPPGSSPKGSITLQCIVTPEGRVTNVRVLDSPDPALNPKAIEAFRQYRFNPAKLNGRPTYATFRETILLSKPEVP
ncbi:MAG TPA: TonB family protein [Blastocatellia bacterium]|nr:TonB family protein [Blastocatellia bacterium]HMV83259.1 TonB family protein [Blastocatellia bacterium]HMX25217.1 TonB family protein [Blastocatellia bacterium]HMY71250.1 TonB family protein [Blastocatellia bacterium]HMZ16765.1 TonB family protein [Blastocatellia bacterium]